MTVWSCPRCGHTETQPAAARDVIHLCGRGQHPIHLTPQAAPQPAATVAVQAELWEAS